VRLRTELRGADSAVGTLGDPFLGLFDSACNLLAANDDSVLGVESRLDFEVPADGVFILAASGCCDGNFDGSHAQQGSYELAILESPPAIGSISGRVVDAVTGEPLPGDAPPYAFAEIFSCGDNGCSFYLSFIPVAGDGRFRIESDNSGNPISAGSYLIASRADGYEPADSGLFTVGAGEDFDVGDILLAPPPVGFANIMPCADLPAAGGVCHYSFRVRNNTAGPISGLGWSIVNADGTGSPRGYSQFPAHRSQLLRLPPNASRQLEFSFVVPGGVADGGFFCVDGWFSDRETAFLGTLHNETLFCVSKQAGAFRPMDTKVAVGLLKQTGQHRVEATGP
jgi:hypothetical protein